MFGKKGFRIGEKAVYESLLRTGVQHVGDVLERHGKMLPRKRLPR